jgi:hypothetical protein
MLLLKWIVEIHFNFLFSFFGALSLFRFVAPRGRAAFCDFSPRCFAALVGFALSLRRSFASSPL